MNRGGRSHWRTSCCLLVLPFLVSSACASALAEEAGETLEAKVKAAFLIKFTNYVEWPAEAFERPDSPLVIAVVETDVTARELARLVGGRSFGRHPLSVRRLAPNEPLTGNHMLFIGSAAGKRTARILATVGFLPVLTVTELDDMPDSTSAINFVIVNDQVRFDISVAAVERGNLRISSRLLSVARTVSTTGR